MSKIDISGVFYIDGELTEEQTLTMFFDKQCKGEKIRVNSAVSDNTDKTQGFEVTISPMGKASKKTAKKKKRGRSTGK